MSEFVVAIILDEYSIGDRFNTWPLHITILPPFEAEAAEVVKLNLQEVVESIQPINVQFGDFAKFGANVIVQKVIPNPELHSLHTKMKDSTESAGWKISEKYTGKRYTPHVTRKKGRDYHGSSFTVSKIALVESLGQGYREVVANLELNNEQ